MSKKNIVKEIENTDKEKNLSEHDKELNNLIITPNIPIEKAKFIRRSKGMIEGFKDFISFTFLKKRLKIYIVSKYGEELYKLSKTLRIHEKTQLFTYKNKVYAVDYSRVILDTKNKPTIYYDINNSIPLGLNVLREVNSEVVNSFFESEVIKDMYAKKPDKMLYILIFGLVIGLVAIGIYSQYTQGKLNQQIIDLTNRLANGGSNVVVIG